MTAQYTAQELKTGLSLAVIANVIWGVSSLYWAETSPLRPQDVVAHRAIWSLPVAAAVLIWAGRMRAGSLHGSIGAGPCATSSG